MPNCFQLVRKNGEIATLQTVDEEMCKHFGVPCRDEEYHAFWYQNIGLGLACGQTFEALREQYRKEVAGYEEEGERMDSYISLHYIAICDWLEANFTVNAWAER